MDRLRQLRADLGLPDTANETAIRILLILVLAVVARWLARRAINGFTDGLAQRTPRHSSRNRIGAERDRQRTITVGRVLSGVVSVTVLVVAALLILGEFGISLGPLLAGAGVVGVALGFGAQYLVRDLIAGLAILIEDQFGVGDVVDAGPATGTVEAVSLRATRLRDVNGVLWIIPNGEITRVGNYSQLWARTVLDVGIAYDADLDKAKQVLLDTATDLWHEHEPNATILEQPEVWGVEDLGDSAVTLRVVVKVEPAEQWTTARILRERIKKAFDEAGIEIPFPQQVVHLAPTNTEADTSAE